MPQPVVEAHDQFARGRGIAQGAQRGHRNGGEIRRAALAKHLVEVCSRQHQHLRDFASPLPLVIAVEGLRQNRDFPQRMADLRSAPELGQEIRHHRLVGATRRKSLVPGELAANDTLLVQQQRNECPPACDVRRRGAQYARIAAPGRQIWTGIGWTGRRDAAGRGVHQPRQQREPFLTESVRCEPQSAGHQQCEVLVKEAPQPAELGFAQCRRHLQAAGEQRQPAVPARQHAGDQIEQPAPALIIEREDPVDGPAEQIILIVRERAPPGLLVQVICVAGHARARARAGRDRQLAGKPGVEGVDGLDAQALRIASDVYVEGIQVPVGRRRQIPGPAVHRSGALRPARRLQGIDDPIAHFMGGAARERQRQNALRGVDAREHAQIALRQQGRLA